MKPKFLSLFLIPVLLSGMLCTGVSAAEFETVGSEVCCFSAADFTEEATIGGVFFTAVPAAADGTVQLGSRVIQAGDVLPTDSLNHLVFLPKSYEDTEAVISYCTTDGCSLGEEQSMTIKIGGQKNEAPMAQDSQFHTYKNIPGQVPLTVSDPENDNLTVTIVKQPHRGTITVNEDGSVTYTPNENKVGKDSFSYTVTDPAGNSSEEATVRITIVKPSEKETYGDMAGNDALLAATWLREEGIFSGETLAGQPIFSPDATVSRGEFVAMCLSLTDFMPGDEDVIATGFSDEEALPQWLRPYMAGALKCGYISGENQDGELTFSASAPITVGQAEDIVSHLLHQAPAEAASAQMLENSPVLTRAEAAMLLYDTWQEAKQNAMNNSLLAWAME